MWWVVIGAIIALLPASCAHMRALWQPPHPVVLLTLDSINVRHLSAYGYGRNTTPNIGRLAREGVLFLRAYSTSAWTSPGLVSILTGLYPTVHGVTRRGNSVPQRLPALAGVLALKGYQTPGLSYLLSLPDYANLGFAPTPTGLGAAPDEADDSVLRRWLARGPEGPFFLWHHYAATHLPYNPPRPYRDRFYREGETITEFVQKIQTAPVCRKTEKQADALPGERIAVEDLYDGELAHQDHLLGQMLDYLRDIGLLDSSLLIVTADHGEELLEHGFVGHASTSLAGTLYNEVTHIPLIMRFPGGRYPGVVDQPVSQVDIMPTILDFLGIEPPSGLQGRSLMALIRGQKAAPRPLFHETTTCGYQCAEGETPGHLTSLILGPWKLISTRKGSEVEFELYNLEQDSSEQHNLIHKENHQAETMKQLMARQILLNQSLASDIRKFPFEKKATRARAPQWAPIILIPPADEILRFSGGESWLALEWSGEEEAEYTIEYQAGSGDKFLSGRFEVRGILKKFGPIPRSTWAVLPSYNPYRFRIRQEPEGPWSPWREFTISAW